MRTLSASMRVSVCGIAATLLWSSVASADTFAKEEAQPSRLGFGVAAPAKGVCLFPWDVTGDKSGNVSQRHMSKDKSMELLLEWANCRVARSGLSNPLPSPVSLHVSPSVSLV